MSRPGSSNADRRAASPRDTDPTSFTLILEALIERIPTSYAAAIVDGQGETVDYAGEGEPFDLKVAAAHLQILLASVERFGALGEPRWVVLRGSRKSIAATALPEGYVLVLFLAPRGAFTISTRALDACVRALVDEAGFGERALPGRPGRRSWYEAPVQLDHRGRPTHVGARKIPVEVLGTVVGLSVRERGFRVRTAEGSELTLVREPGQRWYADEPA